MRWRDLLEKWGLAELGVHLGFLDVKFAPKDPDRQGAWALYMEMLTRVSTRDLEADEGTEAAALASLRALFEVTRAVLRERSGAVELAKLAVLVLNQKLRPFTSRWHRRAEVEKAFDDGDKREEFRRELKELQEILRRYTRAVGFMAGLSEEDLEELEQTRRPGAAED